MNINDRVRAKLTPHGSAVLKARRDERYEAVRATFPSAAKHLRELPATEVFEGSLWELMNDFGPSLYLGCEQLIVDNEIEVID